MYHRGTGLTATGKVITGSKVCIKSDQTVKVKGTAYNIAVDNSIDEDEIADVQKVKSHINLYDDLEIAEDLFDLAKEMWLKGSKGNFTIEDSKITALELSNEQ